MSGFSEDGRLSNSNNALLHKTSGKNDITNQQNHFGSQSNACSNLSRDKWMDLIEQQFSLACEPTLPPFASLQVCDTSTE